MVPDDVCAVPMVVLTDDEFRCMDECTGTVELALLVLRTAAFSAPAALAVPLADEEFRCMDGWTGAVLI